MKQIHNILSGILASALIFVGCTKDYDAPLPNNEELPEATYTISQLKESFLGNPDYLVSDNADNEKYKGVFSVYNMNASQPVTINGIVISTDAGGNTYKKLVIRDPKDGSCIDLSVDVSGISAYYPVGQAVQVTCNTIQIGLYADMPVLGTTYYNNASNRLRYEPGRMPWPVGQAVIKAYGMPDASKAQPVIKTIPEILKGAPDIYSQLVEIDYVEFGYFVNGSSVSLFPTNTFISMNDPKADPNITFSEENDLNVPVSRGIRDNKGNIIPVTTSSYAKFASQKLPKGAFDIKAIVAWYKDQAAKDGNFQMSVQQFSDIIKVSDTFEKDDSNIFEESFATNQGAFTTNSVTGDQVWGFDSKGYMKMSGFAGGKANANEDWLISPAIDLTEASSATISFDQAINFSKTNLQANHTLWFTSDNGTTWTQVDIPTYPAGNNWTFVNSGAITIPAAFLNKANVKFGFKYISTDQEASTWEIQNVVVK